MNKDIIGIGIEYIDDSSIRLLGKLYYSEDYVIEMNRRNYNKGFNNGTQKHQVVFVDNFNQSLGNNELID